MTDPFRKSSPQCAPALEDVYKDIKDELEAVEAKLRMFTSSPNRVIAEINTYLFQKTGKRIRPALLVLSSKLSGYRGDDHILTAALVEFIHTASLIHDDIIDNSSMRRGQDSVHARWGPNITVLLGDYLYIKTIALSLQSDFIQIIRVLTDASAQMIEGELNEYILSGNPDIAESDYLDIIQKKTARLFAASCQIGGILGKASLEELTSLTEYGNSLGMTFQLVDDLLDFKGDEKALGKPTLSDLGEGRITLPLIYSLNNDGRSSRDRILDMLRKGRLQDGDKQEILLLLANNGSLEYTYRKAEEFAQKAKETILRFPQSPHRESLGLLSDFILTRNR